MSLTPHEITKPGLYTEHIWNDRSNDIVLIIDITPEEIIMYQLPEDLKSCKYSYFSLEGYSYNLIGPAKSLDEARQLYPEYFL